MVAVPMVGRAGELAELVQAWAAVAARPGETSRTVVITGPAGVGKSLLITTALAGLHPRPRVILSGSARVHAPAPYDWLAAVLSGRDTSQLRVPADALAWLAQHPDVPRERYAPGALLRLAVRTVRGLIGAGPVAIVVEDLHALDPASLNLVGELAAAPDLPALILVTSRPTGTAVSPHLAARTLARLSGAGALRQHLHPLEPADVATILAQVYPASPVPPDTVATVWERTGGNPYWVLELLAAAGGVGPDRLASARLPDHVRLTTVISTPDDGTAPELTAREIEVLTCLAEGMSNKQVARSLGISVRTVTVHVSSLLRKTQSASRTEAALWAVRRRVAGLARSVPN
jgi:DNA-binding CsgD family transcriptional regulator